MLTTFGTGNLIDFSVRLKPFKEVIRKIFWLLWEGLDSVQERDQTLRGPNRWKYGSALIPLCRNVFLLEQSDLDCSMQIWWK